MKFLNYLVYILITCLTMFSCKHKTEYYIYSQHQLLDSIKQVEKNNLKLNSDFPPTPKGKQFIFDGPRNFYTELVIILDSSDKVYIYQNQQIINNKDFDLIRNNTYSNFIDLKPEHLLTFYSENFFQYLKQNDDIFGLDSLNKYKNMIRFFTLATIQDTIKNPAFYSLQKFIKMYMHDYQYSNSLIKVNNLKTINHNYAILRKTTEEENVVLFHKKNKIKYNPQSIHWSNHFINGNCKPFTNQYDSLENRLKLKYHAISSFKSTSKELLPKCGVTN